MTRCSWRRWSGWSGRRRRARVLRHLARAPHGPRADLVARTAVRGARAFLYPVVEPEDLRGFDVLAVHHPADSVIVARKPPLPGPGHGQVGTLMKPPCKCCKIQTMSQHEGHEPDVVALEKLPS
uniref:Nicotianamine synthase n=1 Tax=Ananas comosus var. bracteatus TaxID=296719 RepID=A0A6V7PRR1_ANACO|nr:unnamed protein product [Ananas comosus var. bracteatus]